jgi:hypothetical protein
MGGIWQQLRGKARGNDEDIEIERKCIIDNVSRALLCCRSTYIDPLMIAVILFAFCIALWNFDRPSLLAPMHSLVTT